VAEKQQKTASKANHTFASDVWVHWSIQGIGCIGWSGGPLPSS